MSFETVPGLILHKKFLTADEIRNINENLAGSTWSSEMSRRVQHYGYQYHYKIRAVTKINQKIPTYLDGILDRLMRENIITTRPNQLIINEYKRGQCISKHVDAPVFGSEIFSISIGASARFILRKGASVSNVVLEEGDVLVMRDEARKDWTHELAPLADLRISFTFRTVG